MKNNNLTKSALVSLLLVSNAVIAEDKYPASDFQPKVVYQDESAASGASTATPAKAAPSSSSSHDSQYPAANFEPKVLYSDSDYKHSAAIPSSVSTSYQSSGAEVTASSSDAGVAAPAKEESSFGYMLGLLVLGGAGFVLFKKGATVGGGSKPKPTPVAKSAGGLTGVAKYVMKASGTGVTRYIEKNVKSTTAKASGSATGVAKYLASQSSSAKPAAKKAATGVEKYMRNKG